MVGCTVKKIEVNYNNSKLSQKKFTVSYTTTLSTLCTVGWKQKTLT